MATPIELDRSTAQSLPEAIARTLRHEVGDLLQTIYAAVAILQKRLPTEATLERQILADLRSRAERCKRLLDNVTDLVSPVSLSLEEVDLGQLAATLVAALAPRYPKLDIRADSCEPVRMPVDEKRISQVGESLLTQACEAALHQVCIRTRTDRASGGVEWAVTDDRPGSATDEQGDYFSPLDITRTGTSGLALALAQRLVQLHGGRITAAPMLEGGFCCRVWLPTKVPFANRASAPKPSNA